MGEIKPSLGVRFLVWLSGAVQRHRAWFVWPHLVLVLLCVWFTITHREFRTSRNDLVGGEKEYHKVFLEFR